MFQLVINTFFVCNVIRVLWSKLVTRESQNSNDTSGYKKSVKATLMLIFLLGLPNIMVCFWPVLSICLQQTIPFTPTQNNIIYFAIWTYFATFFYMYQGLIVSIIYCFTNKEVGHRINDLIQLHTPVRSYQLLNSATIDTSWDIQITMISVGVLGQLFLIIKFKTETWQPPWMGTSAKRSRMHLPQLRW